MADVPTPIILNSLIPAAPTGYRNVKPQTDSLNPQHVSFYVPNVGSAYVTSNSSYIITVGDLGKLIVLDDPDGPIVTLPAASTLPTDFFCSVSAIGASGASIVASSGSVDGLGSLALRQYEGASIYSDGTNFYTVRSSSVSGSQVAGATTFVDLTDTPANYSGAAGFAVEVNASGTGLVFSEKIYRIPFWQKGTYESDEVICTVNIVDAFTLPQNFVGSRFRIDGNPTASWVFSVKKNNVEVGTLTVATDGTVICSSASDIDFVDGDVLTVVAPGIADSTGAGLSGTFKGTRV